jgi:ADP-ribose pyrophosphatase YjhB (NUDIX family)
MERYKIIATVHLLHIIDDKVLLSERKNTGYSDGMYSLVGGHVEQNETIVEAVIREVSEEIAANLSAKDLKLVHVLHRRKENPYDDDRIEFFFTTNTQLQYLNNETNLCANLKWFDINKLPDNIIPYNRHVIVEFYKGNIYSEYGWNKNIG